MAAHAIDTYLCEHVTISTHNFFFQHPYSKIRVEHLKKNCQYPLIL